MTSDASLPKFPAPDEIEGFWTWDKLHLPRPLTPITQDLFAEALSEGFTRAMDEWAYPLGLRCRVVNCYAYAGMVPQDLKGESLAARVERFKQIVSREAPRIGPRWEQEWLPAILPGLEKLRTLDYAAMSDDALLQTLADLRQDVVYRWYVHGWINLSLVAASWFADFYNEQFQPEDPTEPYELLQGFPTRSLDAGRGLWRLSRLVKAGPELSRTFETTNTAELPARLEQSEEGRSFLRELRSYLEEFGRRNDGFELAEPSWYERPTIPLNAIQGYMRLGPDDDPDERFRQAVARREQLLARARERLAADPEKLAHFNRLYEGARYNLIVTEDHNYYIDQVGFISLRFPLLELGRRMVEKGALTNETDVFLLHLSEMGAAMAGADQRALVASRRATIEGMSRVLPPPSLGTPEPPPTDDPFFEALIHKMFGVGIEPSRDPAVITGIGVSAGVSRGVAKVVRTLDEASKLQQGDIMVCEMTMPAWTPLFSTVSAVVADTGGLLSHCAIVCREYRLPCVARTVVGTSVIKDGMELTVDGSKGLVRIESQG